VPAVTSDDDRIAFLGGDDAAPLDPDDRAELAELRDLLADPSVWAEPDPSLEDRILAAIAAESAKDGGGQRTPVPSRPGPQPPASVPSPEPAGQPIPIGRRSRAGRRLVYGAVAAAAVAIAVTVGLVSTGTSAQRYSAALAATGLQPSASGRATLTKTTSGWRIELRASGLARLDNGRFYEAWMKNGAGVLVPIGTFNQGPEVTLWSGVPPTSFPTITVTAQQANGNPASSGQLVLTGTVAVPGAPR
jgi:hypothetical protein